MGDEIRIRPLEPADVEPLAAAFAAAGWPKPREQFERYLAEQSEGARDVWVAHGGGEIRGYVGVVWRPGYPPFREAGIPEIQDLNVLPAFRRRGVATRLIEAAERLVAGRSRVVGIGVGLYDDYGAAQRLYILRGYVPDGHGITWRGRVVAGGETVVADDDLVLHLIRHL